VAGDFISSLSVQERKNTKRIKERYFITRKAFDLEIKVPFL